MPEYHRRTAVTRLDVTDEQRRLLEATIGAYRKGANIASDVGWEYGEDRKTKLQTLAYDTIRERTELGSQHAILAIRQAADALRSVDRLDEQGRSTSKPSFTSPAVTYDRRTMSLDRDAGTVSLTTVGDRIQCRLALPESEDGYQYQYLDGEWELAASTLIARDGGYYLHLGFRREQTDADETAGNRTVLGVDLGIENLAVTSTAHFVSGGELHHRHRQFEAVCGGLQQTGTQSAHRTFVQRGDTEARFNRDYLHQVANDIVREAVGHDCTHVAFEDLQYIRDDMPGRREFHRWAHHQLVQYVTYKAESRGIDVVFVDPANTSRECSECGHVSESNRPERDHLSCEQCQNEANADYDASKSIGLRYVRRGQQSSRRTGDGRLALKSGTVDPETGFVPYETRDTDKSAPSEATS